MQFSRKFDFGRMITAWLAALLLVGWTGCTTTPPKGAAESKPAETALESEPRLTPTEQLALSEFALSAGDQIHITVFQHPELDKIVTIPPNGRIFFPSVGDVQVAGQSLRAVQTTLAAGLAAKREVRIEPGDEIAIQVVRHDEFNVHAAVSPEGTVLLPIAGSLSVVGKTPDQINAEVNKKLAAWIVAPQAITQVLRSSVPAPIGNAQVGVEVLRFSGQKIFVLGEVARPGVLLMEGETGLIEALAMAGGPTLDAEEHSIAVVRPNRNGGRPEVTLVDLEAVVDGSASSMGPVLQRGDVVYVPRSFIADVDRFFNHFWYMIRPITETATGVWLIENIDEGPQRGGGGGGGNNTVIIRQQ